MRIRKIAMALVLLLSVTTSVFAQGFVDTMTCKKVVLHAANNRTVLVKRITGEVKYALKYNGQWVEVKGRQKEKYQAMYNAQIHPKNR